MCIGKIDKPNIENNYKILEYTLLRLSFCMYKYILIQE